jgi:hypothetical protein
MMAGLAFSRAHEERGQDSQAWWASRFDSPKGFVILAVALVAAVRGQRE